MTLRTSISISPPAARFLSSTHLGKFRRFTPQTRSSILVNAHRNDELNNEFHMRGGDVHLFHVQAALGNVPLEVLGDTLLNMRRLGKALRPTFRQAQRNRNHIPWWTLSKTFDEKKTALRRIDMITKIMRDERSTENLITELEYLGDHADEKHLTFLYINAAGSSVMTGIPMFPFSAKSGIKHDRFVAALAAIAGRKVVALCARDGQSFMERIKNHPAAGSIAVLLPNGNPLNDPVIYPSFSDNLVGALTMHQSLYQMKFADSFLPFDCTP